MTKRTLTVFVAICCLLTGLVLSASPGAAQHDAEASPMAGGHGDMGNTGTGAAYLNITNNGDTADRLLAAKTDVAKIVEIHEMVVKDEVMVMSPLEDGLEIPAGETVNLEPGGYHVMLINLTQDLKPGETFPMTLTFEQAGDIEVTVVIGPGAPEDVEPVTHGDLELSGIWSRPAPMLSAGGHGTPAATPSH